MRTPPMRKTMAAQMRQVHFCQRPGPPRRKIHNAAVAAMKAMAIIGFMATTPGAIDLAVSMRKIQPIITRSGTMVGMERTNLKRRRGWDLGAEASPPAGPRGKNILEMAAPDTTPQFLIRRRADVIREDAVRRSRTYMYRREFGAD